MKWHDRFKSFKHKQKEGKIGSIWKTWHSKMRIKKSNKRGL